MMDRSGVDEIEVVVKFERLAPDRMMGLHTDWIVGEAEDGTKVELLTGAGLGSTGLWLSIKRPDGSRCVWGADVRDLLDTAIPEMEKVEVKS